MKASLVLLPEKREREGAIEIENVDPNATTSLIVSFSGHIGERINLAQVPLMACRKKEKGTRGEKIVGPELIESPG